MKPRDIADLLLLAALWGGSFLFMRIAAPAFGPVALIELRVAIGALCLLPMLAWRNGLGQLRPHAFPILVVGAINSALPFSLLAYAILSVTAGFAAILNSTVPLFAALVAYLWLNERLSRARIAGLAIGFAGVIVLVWGKVSFKAGGTGLAVIAALVAALLYGIASIYTQRRLRGVAPLAIATGSQIGAALLLLPFAWWLWPQRNPGSAVWLAALALGVVSTGFAYILYFRLIANVGPAKAVTVAFLIPMFGMLWGAMFLAEPVTLNMIGGCGVILLGTGLTTGLLQAGRARRERSREVA